MILQLGIDRAKTGAIVPKDALMLRQSVKKFKGVAVFIFRSPIKANGDFTEIGYLFQFLDDVRQRISFEFRKKRRENERHRPLLRKFDELGFHLIDGSIGEIVKGGNASALVKI
jgi:hypothetical protein